MGLYLTKIDVNQQMSWAGKTGTLNPDYLEKAFNLVRHPDFGVVRGSEPANFADLSPQKSFKIIRHYELGTFSSRNMRREVGGVALSTANYERFEALRHGHVFTQDISRVEVETDAGDSYTLPGSAVLLELNH